MRCYLNFIFLSIKLLLVQSDDLDSNYFYQNLLMTTTYQSNFLSTSSLPTKDKSPMLYRHGFYEQSFSKIQRTTYSTVLYTLDSFKRRFTDRTFPTSKYSEYHKFPTQWDSDFIKDCGHQAQTCGKWQKKWCCYGYLEQCGTTYDTCNAPEVSDFAGTFIFLIIIAFCLFACTRFCTKSQPTVGLSYSPVVQSGSPVSNNSYSVQQEQTSALSNCLSRDLEVTRQGTTENINLQSLGSRILIRNTLLTNSIGSMEQHLPAMDNFSTRRATATSSSPPTYDDVIHQNSITITIEQESILPPTYDDFMQESDRREETSL